MLFDGPWWDVAMKIFLAFSVLVIVFALAMLIIVASRMLGAWWGRRRLVKLRKKRGLFQKNKIGKWK